MKSIPTMPPRLPLGNASAGQTLLRHREVVNEVLRRRLVIALERVRLQTATLRRVRPHLSGYLLPQEDVIEALQDVDRELQQLEEGL